MAEKIKLFVTLNSKSNKRVKNIKENPIISNNK